MNELTAYFNGEWIPNSEVKIHATDRGFLVGDTVFDVARTFNGKSFRMKEHVARLYRSLQYARINPSIDKDQMLLISEDAIKRNEHIRHNYGDFTIHQFVTRGPKPPSGAKECPTVGVRLAPVEFTRYAQSYATGVHGVIAKTRSYSPESLDPKIKHYSRMNFNLAQMEATDVDPDAWPIMLDLNGNLTEGVGWNVLIVTDGVIRSSTDKAVLQGVSRGMVFDLAKQLDIPVVQEDLQPYDLYTADEAFFTTTSPCVLPVTKVDNRQIGDGLPGPITQQLLASWSESVGIDIVDQAVSFSNR